jgi:branched-chain amino acid aminotransferase
MFAFINDAFVPAADASIPVSDLAVSRGYGVFDYFKVLAGKPVFLNEHLNRLFFSAHEMRLSPAYSKKALEKIIFTFIEKNETVDAGIRITITGGSGDGYTIGKPRLIITQHSLVWPPPAIETGIRLSTFEHQRQLPHIKTIDYLLPIRMQPLLMAEDADDFLYHKKSVITEAPRANFFIVNQNNEVITPKDNILKGVTRCKLVEAATGRYQVKERDILMEEAFTAREAFITSTTKGVMRVNSIDGKQIGDKKENFIVYFRELLKDLITRP